MIIVKLKLVEWLGASALTAYPFVFVDPAVKDSLDKGGVLGKLTLQHEAVHYAQQRRWCIYGLGVGLLVWWALYLGALPVGWNPFRRRAETQAYLACGFELEVVEDIMREKPYYLWGG